MAEYINKTLLIEEINKNIEMGGNKRAAQLLYCILNAPKEDVAPVEHGRWEKIKDPYGKIEGWLCKCGREVKIKEKYCPNCGAKMDLK